MGADIANFFFCRASARLYKKCDESAPKRQPADSTSLPGLDTYARLLPFHRRVVVLTIFQPPKSQPTRPVLPNNVLRLRAPYDKDHPPPSCAPAISVLDRHAGSTNWRRHPGQFAT